MIVLNKLKVKNTEYILSAGTRIILINMFSSILKVLVVVGTSLKVIYHPLYGMNNYVLIRGDWLSCDPLEGSHNSQWGDWLSCDSLRESHDSQSPHIMKHLCPILWQF